MAPSPNVIQRLLERAPAPVVASWLNVPLSTVLDTPVKASASPTPTDLPRSLTAKLEIEKAPEFESYLHFSSPQRAGLLIFMAKNPTRDIDSVTLEEVEADSEAMDAIHGMEDFDEAGHSLTKPLSSERGCMELALLVKKYATKIPMDLPWAKELVKKARAAAAYVRYSRALRQAPSVAPLSDGHSQDRKARIISYYKKRMAPSPEQEELFVQEAKAKGITNSQEGTDYVAKKCFEYVVAKYEADKKFQDALINYLKFWAYEDNFVYDTLNSPTISVEDAMVLMGGGNTFSMLDKPLFPQPKCPSIVAEFRYELTPLVDQTDADYCEHIRGQVVDAIYKDYENISATHISKTGNIPVTLVWEALKRK